MADCSLLSADVGQKNLLSVFEPLIYEYLNQPSRILPHLNTLIPLRMFHSSTSAVLPRDAILARYML